MVRFMTCTQCKLDLYPTNPEVGCTIRGHYLAPLCRYCPSSDNGRPDMQLENMESRIIELEKAQPSIWSSVQNEDVQQLRGHLLYLQKQIKDMAAIKRRGDKL